ncbi:hypothetical protein [Bacillus infantis]|uniref:Uncharacterized protein n=1 Tax=Bacillus infantis TaxID=324767 RepID=A0A5D4RL10_9BACI|nr:hypothetical protein [Bacillus infantis]TYS50102.1 hypothetical protein FZD51_05995 [Bacillus infantis]
MIDNYNDLSDLQRNNLGYFLERADSNRLSILHHKFNVQRARNNTIFRENTVRDLMFGHIPFPYFLEWLSEVELEGNNSLFIYEAEETDFLKNTSVKVLYENSIKLKTPLYDINAENLNEIKLVNVSKIENKNQVLFSLAAPAQVQVKKLDGQMELRKHVYLAYIIVDFNLSSVVLFMHPTVGLASVYGESKRRDIDDVTWIILHFFREKILAFTLKEPDWIVNALSKISEEYFYHNNPIIEEKIENFSNEHITGLLKSLKKINPELDREDSMLRLRRSLESAYESEMIVIHRRIEKELPFQIFLQQTDRGLTQFRANTRGKALSHSEAADIIRLMWEHGDVLNVGLIHREAEKEYQYIIKKLDKYFSLKKYTTSGTGKEVVDNVLRKLNEYKEEIESTSTFSELEEFGRGVDDSQA